jgi:N-acetyl-anhydromuramyl-L-alanine amidase AmpD
VGLLAAGLAALGILAVAGCQQQVLIATTPPAMKPDRFVYKPLPAPPPAPAPAPVEPPQALEIPRKPAEPPLPAHDASWEPQAPERPWRWIVIHHSATDAGSAAAFDNFHRNGRHWDELGYHFVVGNGGGSGDGAVEVGSRWPKQKWGAHCRVGDNEEYNYFGIGICLVGNFDRRRPSEAQMQSAARLVAYLAARYHIDDAHIIGHGSVGDTRCPGRCFPMSDLLARVHRLLAEREGLASAN